MQKLSGVLLFAVALSACSGSGPVGSGLPNQQSGRWVASIGRASSPTDLYVSDLEAKAVFRFPLTNGIPAATPDAVIGGFTKPRGIAIGPDGHLFVVDAGAHKLLIFAPHPETGATPVRTIAINHPNGLNSVGVGPSGNTFVNYTVVCTTEGFVCGFSDVYSGFAQGSKFIETLNFGGGPPSAVIRSMAFNPEAQLAVELGSQGTKIYTNVIKNNTNPYSVFCGAENLSGQAWGTTPTELFETDLGFPGSSHPPQIVVVPNYLDNPSEHCPSFSTITSATIPLKNPYAIASIGKIIYVTNGHSDTLGSGVVLVFDSTKSGSQTPLAALDGPGSQLRVPIGIAVGP